MPTIGVNCMAAIKKKGTKHSSNTSPVNQAKKYNYIMTTSNNTKVLVKFGTSDMKCVELRAEKLSSSIKIRTLSSALTHKCGTPFNDVASHPNS